MTNFQIYKKVLPFSLLRALFGLVTFAIFLGITALGGFIGNRMLNDDSGLVIGLLIGAIVGAILVGLLTHFLAYSLKAGEIAMITRAVSGETLPEKGVVKEGVAVVKKRFVTVFLFYLVVNAIKGIFHQLSRAITGAARLLGGGQNGGVIGGIASIVDSAVQILISYLGDCCLGWVFYREEIGASKAACEGACIFFKHGKTLAKNAGRIFGMGFLSFLILAGGFTGIFYLAFNAIPGFADFIMNEFQITETWIAILVSAAFVSIVLWSIFHSVFVHPFILVGVLRNFIASGIKDKPKESDFAEVSGKSRRFEKLQSETRI